mmetsp:Transcript_49431/g.159556  ORF Transcript_49431/g.159556 Transcript_49431/m.159556 type:complete len:239 (+) Transcript_49431:327-1043(+)
MWQAPCTCPIPHHLCRSSSNSDCQVLAVTSTCAALFARTCPSLMPRCQALCGTKADPSRWWPQKLRTFVEKDSWGTSNPSLPVSHENKRPRVLASSSSAAAAAASGGTGGTKGQCLRGLMGPTLSSKAAAAAAQSGSGRRARSPWGSSGPRPAGTPSSGVAAAATSPPRGFCSCRPARSCRALRQPMPTLLGALAPPAAAAAVGGPTTATSRVPPSPPDSSRAGPRRGSTRTAPLQRC